MSKYTKLQGKVSNALRLLNDINGLPEVLQHDVESLKNLIKNYDLQQHRPPRRTIDGVVASENDLLEIIKETTGYTKWANEATDEDEADFVNLDHLKDHFGIEFPSHLYNYFRFYRRTNNRSAIHMIEITAIPGHFYLNLATDRASYDIDRLLTKDELKKQLEREFEDND